MTARTALSEPPTTAETTTGTSRRTDGTPFAWTTTPSPIGPLLVITTPAGVARVCFATEDHSFALTQWLGDRPDDRSADPVEDRTGLDEAVRHIDDAVEQLAAYFAGSRTDFDVPVDLGAVQGFSAAVLDELLTIPYGEVRSYGEVANNIDNPAAVRAVGGACGRNPVPLLVPCHRVLRSDGSLGGFGGGLDVKRFLLDLESSVRADVPATDGGDTPAVQAAQR
ncbi:MAG: methylated-DNA--[protein]-cysteine S-methyltransferase [Acidimicrobiia bacterium]|nr:methylated-DNA--[protein]-cysteine S-methyltransferase [Acidimicrobiia bacterium]